MRTGESSSDRNPMLRLSRPDALYRRLMARYQAGDAQAFELLHTTLAQDLSDYLDALLPVGYEMALLEEVFLAIHEVRRSYDPRRPFEPWASAIVRHVALSRRRIMTANKVAAPPRVADFLLSWDRLGFRLLVFGGLALMWILQGRLSGATWEEVVRAELAGLMPWAFLAPIVLAANRRIRIERLGLGRFLAAHLLGMVVVFIPYWCIVRVISLVWAGMATGWEVSRLVKLVPTKTNVLAAFLNVPFVYFVILLGAEAMRHADARHEEEAQADRLARQLADARLALLQRQLHPHFLFNALQAISTLLHRDPATADRLLVHLSALLRAMLENASGQVLSLGTELELTRKYLEIEHARFEDRLSVEWCVDQSLLDVEIPSLIVLPLVENAIRHGLSRKIGPGRLTIAAGRSTTDVRGARSEVRRPMSEVDTSRVTTLTGASLVLTVADDGLGATVPLRSGLGIGNTRDRLDAIYGARAALTIEAPPTGGFRATITIPLPEGRS